MKHARPLSSVTLRRVATTHKSAVLLSDCSCGTAKKATSDRTETHHTQGMMTLRQAWNLSPVLVAEMCRLVLVVVRCAQDRVLRTFTGNLVWFPWRSCLSLQASSLVGVGFLLSSSTCRSGKVYTHDERHDIISQGRCSEQGAEKLPMIEDHGE